LVAEVIAIIFVDGIVKKPYEALMAGWRPCVVVA
jgi:hypothetical protein